MLLSAEQERRLIVDALLKLGIRQPDAECTADVLVEADLRGHGSHGLGRLRLVIERIHDGSVDVAGVPTIEHERPAALRINGNRSLGPPAGKPGCIRVIGPQVFPWSVDFWTTALASTAL